jgi:hypothetical protein
MNAETKVGIMDKFKTNKIIAYAMLLVGLASVAASIFGPSFILAFIGIALTFWGALLLYIAPSKHVPLELMNATAAANLVNIEKILANADLKGKGVYLPPKYLKDFESSLVFIPSSIDQTLPTPEEVDEEKLYSKNPKGIFLTPPGLALSKLFEKQLGTSFTRTDLRYIQEKLPKLLIEDMEIADDVEITTEQETNTIQLRVPPTPNITRYQKTVTEKEKINVKLTNHIFKELCEETQKMQRTHMSVGCPLSSALACALAKATGKPITIEKEEQSEDGKTTTVQYHMLEA